MSADHIKAFLESLGLRLEDDPELQRTPERVAELFGQLFSSVGVAPDPLSVFEDQEYEDLVTVSGIEFQSLCVHHLVPFFGTIDIVYLPAGRLAGFGGFHRLVDHLSRRPQLQERLVRQIGDEIETQLQPKGLFVRCGARQMCVELRRGTGHATYETCHSTGVLRHDSELRSLALATLQRAS